MGKCPGRGYWSDSNALTRGTSNPSDDDDERKLSYVVAEQRVLSIDGVCSLSGDIYGAVGM